MRVVNASPLIHLARVSLLDLLRVPGQDVAVVVPFIVFQEVLRGARYDPTTSLVEQAARDWLAIVPTLPPHPGIDRGRIDAGEIAVLTVALATPGATVVLDDLAARAEADRLGIPKIGTLRLLLDAKQLGIIPSVLAPIDRLRELGMRLSDSVYREVLRQAEELPPRPGDDPGIKP
jgi:predicted nucleic acid-binding protein